MDAKEFLSLENKLKGEFGDERLRNMVDEISNCIRKNNLDVTPTILGELFEYIKKFIQISKI